MSESTSEAILKLTEMLQDAMGLSKENEHLARMSCESNESLMIRIDELTDERKELIKANAAFLAEIKKRNEDEKQKNDNP